MDDLRIAAGRLVRTAEVAARNLRDMSRVFARLRLEREAQVQDRFMAALEGRFIPAPPEADRMDPSEADEQEGEAG